MSAADVIDIAARSFREKDIRVRIDQIDVHLDQRFRPKLSEPAIAKLMASYKRSGLKQRIGVCHEGARFRLVWGGHRYEALRRLGETEIDARLVNHARESRELDEIEENLVREQLEPLDHAAHMVRALELLAGDVGVTIGANARALGAAATNAKRALAAGEKPGKAAFEDARVKMAHAYNLRDQLAVRAGVSVSTIKRAVELHRGFSAAEKEQLRGTDFAQNASQLRRLAQLAGDDRGRMIDAIVRGAATWNDAESISAGKRVAASARSDVDKQIDRMAKWWATMPRKDRARLLELLVAQDRTLPKTLRGLPAGTAIVTPSGRIGDA